MHTYQINDFVSWQENGNTERGRIIGIHGKKAEILLWWGYTVTKSLAELTYLPPIVLHNDPFRRLVRLEGNALEQCEENDPERFVNGDGYRVTVEDLLAALEKLSAGQLEAEGVEQWLDFLEAVLQKQPDSEGIYTQTDVLRSMCSYIRYAWGCSELTPLTDAIQEGRSFLEDRNLEYRLRRYPLYFKEALLRELSEDVQMQQASEESVELYRMFALELAEAGNPCGLDAVGYGCYGGNRAFACDWQRSRECISRLFELEEVPRKAFLANTLGYIYYYGRCSDGVPDYAQAYKYFSFAAFNGVYEAKYKIADMYLNGYGVCRSPETARTMIGQLYEENLPYICNGQFDCKFADVALRMGKLSEDSGDAEQALYYYTQAEYAIRMRMAEVNSYGDAKVAAAIRSALTELQAQTGFRVKRSVRCCSLEWLLDPHLRSGNALELVIRKQNAHTYKLTFSHHKRWGKEKKLFLTLPEIGLCGLYSKITATYEAREALEEALLDRTLVVDECNYQGFCYDGSLLLETDGVFLIRNSKSKQEKIYRLVSVSFGSGALYDYICEDPTVTEGDRVLVNAAGEEKTVTVCRVHEKREWELALPGKAYKKVIRKV